MPGLNRYKIAYVVPTLNIVENNGVLEVLKQLIRYIDFTSFDVHILVFYSEDIEATAFRKMGANVHVASENQATNTYLLLMGWVTEKLNAIQPHIVHTHLFWADTIGREAAIRCNVPVIITTEHNTNENESQQQRAIKKRLAKNTDAIVCITNAVRSYSISMDGVDGSKTKLIYNGFNIEKYGVAHIHEIDRLSGKFYFIGRFVEQKSPLQLIHAFATLIVSNPSITLHCIGDGPLYDDCQKLITELGMQGSIFLTGYKENPFREVEPCSVLVLNSSFEGLGIVLLEAMAQGVLCLAPDCGGIPEVIAHNKTGFLFKTSDEDALKEAVNNILSTAVAKLNDVRLRAYQTVLEEYRPQKMTASYLELYRELLKNKERRAMPDL